MKLTIRQDQFASATGWAAAAGCTPRAGLSPALAGLLLTASADGTVTIAGYDYEVSALARLTCGEIGEPGRALLPGRLLAQAAAALPVRYDVTLTADGTRAVITAGPVTYTLLQLPHDDYPALPQPGAPAGTFGAAFLAATVAQAGTAASHDDTLPALTCIRIELDGNGTATFAATDRYRLAVATCPYTPESDGDVTGPMLLPARQLAAITRNPGTATVTMTLSEDDAGTVAFTTDDRQVTVRAIAGEFPRYTTLIPGGEDCPHPVTATITADVADLADAVKRAAIVAPTKEHPVRLTFTPDEIRLEAGTSDDAGYTDTIPAQLDGDQHSIAFKPRYLLDALGAIAGTGATTARIGITGPAKPALITPDGRGPVHCHHIVMPIKSAR